VGAWQAEVEVEVETGCSSTEVGNVSDVLSTPIYVDCAGGVVVGRASHVILLVNCSVTLVLIHYRYASDDIEQAVAILLHAVA
jgi:hypothetical protein